MVIKKIDYSAIDWQTLSTFLTIIEEPSVSRAAHLLGGTQSTVSHTRAHPLTGRMMCFFDGATRDAPTTWEEYCAADHLVARFPDGGTSLRALSGVDKSQIRTARVSVPDFNAIPSFIQGAKLLATEMNLMKLCTLSSLDMAPLPIESDPLTNYMTWHRRSTNYPAHNRLRERIERIAEEFQQPAAVS